MFTNNFKTAVTLNDASLGEEALSLSPSQSLLVPLPLVEPWECPYWAASCWKLQHVSQSWHLLCKPSSSSSPARWERPPLWALVSHCSCSSRLLKRALCPSGRLVGAI